MLLLVAIPPGNLDSETYFPVDFGLAAEDSPGALHALLDVLSNFLDRRAQWLVVLLDDGKNIFYVDFG